MSILIRAFTRIEVEENSDNSTFDNDSYIIHLFQKITLKLLVRVKMLFKMYESLLRVSYNEIPLNRNFDQT